MIAAQEQKIVVLSQPGAALDNAAATVSAIDTLEWDYLTIYAILGATDAALTVLKLTESDASGSGYVDIPETVYGASGNPALPNALADNSVYGFFLNLANNRCRYIKPAAAVADGSVGGYVTIVAILSRGKTVPSDDASRGLAQGIYL